MKFAIESAFAASPTRGSCRGHGGYGPHDRRSATSKLCFFASSAVVMPMQPIRALIDLFGVRT